MKSVITILTLMTSIFPQEYLRVYSDGDNMPANNLECYFFFIPDCPASRVDMPVIMELHKKFGPRGLVIKAIMSDPSPNDSVLTSALNNYNFTLPITRDTTLDFARVYGATTTPQVMLFDGNGNQLYSGQVNNYYYKYGKHRSRVNQNFLEDAIVSALEGNPIDIAETKPIGCKINFD